MLEQLKSLFSRKAHVDVVNEPAGATVLFNAYCTRTEIARPEFAHKLHNRRDLADPELLAHLGRLCSHVYALGDGQMTPAKYHVILHLQRVRHHLAISVGVDDVAALQAWAQQANAILFNPEGHFVDPAGRVLVDGVDGSADPEARLPYPERALAGKAATELALKDMGIVVPETLPPLVCEDELILRERDEVVGRARALLLVVLRADSVASGQPVSVAALIDKMPLADDYLSPEEKEFLAMEAPPREECAKFIWRYESLFLLEWALGLVEALPPPNAPCDAASTVATLIEMRGPELRPAADIIEQLDLHYRLHWHVRQQRLKKKSDAAGIDADVVMERHRALNWLVRFQHAPWDEVDTPT